MKQPADLRAAAGTLGCDLDQMQAERMLEYLALLQKWNRVHNLTAVRDTDDMFVLHLLDSLAVTAWMETALLLDVGSGGGLPGIPLAIARPAMQVELIDSNLKKISFLRQAVIELGLRNVTVRSGRVEQLDGRGRYPGIIARAFAETGELVRLTRARLAPHGRWYVMKGAYPEAELRELPPGVVVESVHALDIPGLRAERHLLILKDDHEQDICDH